jgi:hypothetical protein
MTQRAPGHEILAAKPRGILIRQLRAAVGRLLWRRVGESEQKAKLGLDRLDNCCKPLLLDCSVQPQSVLEKNHPRTSFSTVQLVAMGYAL